MNKCDKSEYQLFDSMIRFIKNGVLLVREPHSAANVAIIIQIWKSFIQESVSDKDSYDICLQIIYL